MKMVLRVTDVLTLLGYRCLETCQLTIHRSLKQRDQITTFKTMKRGH